jgi:crotonobetainyl-CoA:carnitine CoA-transferase CaiB-like acyl-CoA transferase
MSGMSASYVADDADGAYLGLGVLDLFSGYVAFSAILAAVLQRAQTGRGQSIDVSMLDAAMLLMAPRIVSQQFNPGERSQDGLGRRPTMVRYRAADRRLFVAALHRKWFVKLCDIIGAPELADDPRFASQRSQAEHADALISAIEARLATRSASEWEAEFVQAGLPASVVRTLQEILAHPHLAARGTLQPVDVPELGRSVNVVGAGFRFEHDQPAFQGPVPRLGEHTAEVLAELGLAES